jgi:hypothetical protein
VIEYPQYLDDEDMDLALKEWKLSGFHIDSGESNEGLRYIDVSHPDDGVDQITDAPGAYVQRKDGYWILVPHERYPAWKDALEFAEAYDVGS